MCRSIGYDLSAGMVHKIGFWSHLIGDSDRSVEFLRLGILGAEEELGDLVLLSRSDIGGELEASSRAVASRERERKSEASSVDAALVGGEKKGSSAGGFGADGLCGGDLDRLDDVDGELIAEVVVGLVSAKNADADAHRSLPLLTSVLLKAKFCFPEVILALSSTTCVIFLELIKFPINDCNGEIGAAFDDTMGESRAFFLFIFCSRRRRSFIAESESVSSLVSIRICLRYSFAGELQLPDISSRFIVLM